MATATNLDKNRGPKIEGTRITVYTLLPHFLDPAMTEASIGRLYDLQPEQVASARAYVLNNAETVLANHLQIEARMAAGNPPEVVESARQAQATFLRFREWLAQRGREESAQSASPESSISADRDRSQTLLTFKRWLAEEESRRGEAS